MIKMCLNEIKKGTNVNEDEVYIVANIFAVARKNFILFFPKQ